MEIKANGVEAPSLSNARDLACENVSCNDGESMRPPFNWRGLILAATLAALAAPLVYTADGLISKTLRTAHIHGDFRKALDLSEAFAHGIGVTAILSTIWIVSVSRRRSIALAICMTLSSGLIANGLKATIVRIRPHSEGLKVVQEPSKSEHEGAVAESFWDSRQRSFPSGHSATAWGLAIGLAWVFPRAMGLFFVFATMASLQRITSGAHYPSDVLAGASIAFLCCGLCVVIGRKWCPSKTTGLLN